MSHEFSVSRFVRPLAAEDVAQQYLADVDRRLREGLSAAGLVRDMLVYQLASGGKRARALLPVWACVNFGGQGAAALDLGVGLELLHNATLIHDDVQDGDRFRRGRPAVWVRWGTEHAINAGDALFFEAFACIARAPAASRVMGTIVKAMVRLAEGQSMELQLQLLESDPCALPRTLATWEAVARRKTGMLFAACLHAGAAAAEQTDAALEAAFEYGESLGVLFQLQDDYLDLVGDKGRRRCGSDLVEGKLSYPVLWALEHASEDELAPLRSLLDTPRDARTDAAVTAALEALKRSGALAATALRLRELAAAAAQHPMARVIPGFVEQCLAPVAHALPPQSRERPLGPVP